MAEIDRVLARVQNEYHVGVRDGKTRSWTVLKSDWSPAIAYHHLHLKVVCDSKNGYGRVVVRKALHLRTLDDTNEKYVALHNDIWEISITPFDDPEARLEELFVKDFSKRAGL